MAKTGWIASGMDVLTPCRSVAGVVLHARTPLFVIDTI
jgi:hypothetical protein